MLADHKKRKKIIKLTRNFLKKIYDEVTEDIFDMSTVRIFKEMEKKKWGMLSLVS